MVSIKKIVQAYYFLPYIATAMTILDYRHSILFIRANTSYTDVVQKRKLILVGINLDCIFTFVYCIIIVFPRYVRLKVQFILL